MVQRLYSVLQTGGRVKAPEQRRRSLKAMASRRSQERYMADFNEPCGSAVADAVA